MWFYSKKGKTLCRCLPKTCSLKTLQGLQGRECVPVLVCAVAYVKILKKNNNVGIHLHFVLLFLSSSEVSPCYRRFGGIVISGRQMCLKALLATATKVQRGAFG